MRLLAICGSLRAASSNRSALEAVRLLAPAGVEVLPWHGLGGLPHFNPDLDTEQAPATPPAVAALRRLVGECDGLLISSPEYAHDVAGSLKNALDWLVSCSEFPGKPVALINTSPRATHAQAALAETLRTMSARLVEAAFVTLPLSGRTLDGAGIAADPEFARPLAAGLQALVREVRAGA
ncbi:MAG TPA: NAD(P)H-dependent oxidoreductase [Nevskia sp.]|nr:NAD(P)H-dependent oxidoreductase [Nevskia sp.]